MKPLLNTLRLASATIVAGLAVLAGGFATEPAQAQSPSVGIGSLNSTPTQFYLNGSWWYGPVRTNNGLYDIASYYSYKWSHWADCYSETFTFYGCFWR